MYHIYKKLKFITKNTFFFNNGGKTISDGNLTY